MTIGDWLTMAYAIDRRRGSAARYVAEARHGRAFPVTGIEVELDLGILDRAGAILKGPPQHYQTGFARPHRGGTDAQHTPIIVAPANRSTRLRAAGLSGNHPPAP